MTEIEINKATIDRAREGAELTEAELIALDSADVLSLGMLADEVRRARLGDRVGFVRVLEVDQNGIPEGEASAPALAAAQEVRITTPAETLEATLALIGKVRERAGAGRRVSGFSLADVVQRGWGDLAAVLTAFKAAGLDVVAEAPADLVSIVDVSVAVNCGAGPLMLSVREWPGERRVPLLMQARAIVAANPTVTRFAPLSREQSITAPTTGYHDVRMVALARLALPDVETIDVDWQQYGPKLAQVALMFGANHLDRVSPIDDPALGPRRASAEEVRRNIIAAGFTPADANEAQ